MCSQEKLNLKAYKYKPTVNNKTWLPVCRKNAEKVKRKV